MKLQLPHQPVPVEAAIRISSVTKTGYDVSLSYELVQS